jgi:FkbM family methyltransferase
MMISFDYLVNKHNLDIKGVLHLGASTGQERKEYDNYCKGDVLWVEAIPSVYLELVKNIEPYKNQRAFNACLSNVDNDEVVFNVSNNESQSSSMLELGTHLLIHPEVHYIEQITMKTKRVDTLFNGYSFKNINFLNVDLQGAEHLAIEGMGDLIKNIDYALLEVNMKETYKGCMLIPDLDYFMMQRGFERVETGDWVADTWTDALYVRKFNI